MKPTLHKVCIVLALVAVALLELASVTGSTLAYLHASESLTNTFTFAEYQPPLGQNRTDRVNYYYINANGTSTQIRDNGYTNNTWTYRANERVYVNSSNTNIKTPPNGFRLAYVTVANTRVNAGSSFLQPNQNNTQVNVYFEPITYTITYDFNGYNESDITFSQTPLQSTYTVFDMINVPYEADSIQTYTGLQYWLYCELLNSSTIRCQDVPSMHVQDNTLLGWEDQNNTLHTYSNASGSWESAIGSVSNTGVYNAFAARQSGDLVLTARWQYEMQRSIQPENVEDKTEVEQGTEAEPETEKGGIEEVQDGEEDATE